MARDARLYNAGVAAALDAVDALFAAARLYRIGGPNATAAAHFHPLAPLDHRDEFFEDLVVFLSLLDGHLA